MRARLVVIAVLGCLVFVASAQGFVWHLSFYKVKAATRAEAKEICEGDGRCIAYGASCRRLTESRIDCIEGTVDETAYGELECQTVLHWGVGSGGRVKARYGSPHCFYLE